MVTRSREKGGTKEAVCVSGLLRKPNGPGSSSLHEGVKLTLGVASGIPVSIPTFIQSANICVAPHLIQALFQALGRWGTRYNGTSSAHNPVVKTEQKQLH